MASATSVTTRVRSEISRTWSSLSSRGESLRNISKYSWGAMTSPLRCFSTMSQRTLMRRPSVQMYFLTSETGLSSSSCHPFSRAVS